MGDQPENFPHGNGFHVDENDPLLQDDGENPEIDLEEEHPVDIQEAAIVVHYADGGQGNIPVPVNLENLESVAAGSNEQPQEEYVSAEAKAKADLHNGYTGMPNNSYNHSITSSSGSSTVQDRSEQVNPDVGPESLLLPDKNGHEDESADDGFESELSDPTENADVSTHLLSDNNDDHSPGSAHPASSSYKYTELLLGNFRVRATINECIASYFTSECTFLSLIMFLGRIMVAAFFAEGFEAMQLFTWSSIVFCVLLTCLILFLIVDFFIAEMQKRR